MTDDIDGLKNIHFALHMHDQISNSSYSKLEKLKLNNSGCDAYINGWSFLLEHYEKLKDSLRSQLTHARGQSLTTPVHGPDLTQLQLPEPPCMCGPSQPSASGAKVSRNTLYVYSDMGVCLFLHAHITKSLSDNLKQLQLHASESYTHRDGISLLLDNYSQLEARLSRQLERFRQKNSAIAAHHISTARPQSRGPPLVGDPRQQPASRAELSRVSIAIHTDASRITQPQQLPPSHRPTRMPTVLGGRDNVHYCLECDTTLRTGSEYRKHMVRHVKPFRCGVQNCSRGDLGFGSKKDLERHKRSVHPNLPVFVPRYVCRIGECGRTKSLKIWPRADNFRKHLHQVHRIKILAKDNLDSYIYHSQLKNQVPLRQELQGGM